MMMGQWGVAARLGMADLRAEPLLALCSVLGLAAVLAPLLILAGLRAGVVQGLREGLLEGSARAGGDDGGEPEF